MVTSSRVRLLVLIAVAAVFALAIAVPGFQARANPAPSCGVSGTVEGKVTLATPIYWGPNSTDIINYLNVSAGQSFSILGIDSTNSWYKIDMSCSAVWVPADAVQPAWAVTTVVS